MSGDDVRDEGRILGRDENPGFSPAIRARINRRRIAELEEKYPGYRFHIVVADDEPTEQN